MSNIPRAREHLYDALRRERANDPAYMRTAIRLALSEMTRQRPKFIAEVEVAPLTKMQREIARRLRYQKRWSLNRIAVFLHTNIGRVSTAVNGKH